MSAMRQWHDPLFPGGRPPRFLVEAGVYEEPSNLIDCDATPWRWCYKIEEHRQDGLLVFSATAVVLHLSDRQKGERDVIKGDDLYQELSALPVLNASVLDWLCNNPGEIPKGWAGHLVFFWGTIYSDHEGKRFVRYLYMDEDGHRHGHHYLKNWWCSANPAAVLVG